MKNIYTIALLLSTSLMGYAQMPTPFSHHETITNEKQTITPLPNPDPHQSGMACTGVGPNFVGDPSFEDNTGGCPSMWSTSTIFPFPSSTDELAIRTSTWSAPSTGTSDYFHTCSPANVQIPSSIFGYQWPSTGNAFAGLFTYSACNCEYREYVQAQLPAALKSGDTYCVQVKYSLGDESNFSSNNMGVCVSNTAITNAGFNPIVVPFGAFLVEEPAMMNDSVNWQQLSGTFVASGFERYITVGNFKSNALTTTLATGNGNPSMNGAYYFVDDVSIFCLSCGFLPLSFIHFDAKLNKNNVELSWKISETNGAKEIVVQKSLDGYTFEDIYRSAKPMFNHFMDREVTEGQWYYRIKAIDFDDEESYSIIQSISYAKNNNALDVLYTQNNNVTLKFRGDRDASNGIVLIFDKLGRKISETPISISKGPNALTLDINNYASGMYTIVVMNNETKLQGKLVKY